MARDAMVLARPERRRMLLELLSLSDWTVVQRVLYADLIHREWVDTRRTASDDGLLAHMQKRVLANALSSGMGLAQAIPVAQGATLKDMGLAETDGQRERNRRRRHREAVTALDAREVLHTLPCGECVTACLVCHKPLTTRRRADAVYCPGGACKQRAARIRAGTTRPLPMGDDEQRQQERA